jgi:hypothetical protein
MTPHLQHPTRHVPRPLRQGDRVKDTLAVFGYYGDYENYPGDHAFGTVIAGPTLRGLVTLVRVRFDDHVEGWVSVGELQRL